MKTADANAKQLRDALKAVVHRFRAFDSTAASQARCELSVADVQLVEYLGDRGGCMMRTLAEFLSVAVNTMTSIVDRMEQKKLVRRERDEVDRRVVRIQLTNEGVDAYRGISELRLEVCRLLLAPLNDAEQDILMVLMRKVGSVDDGAIERHAA